MRLHGKVALVTGSGQGIGQAIANRFSSEGAHVVVSDIVAERAAAAAAEIQKKGGKASHVLLDVANESSIQAAFEEIAADFGGVDIHVNNAGVGINAPYVEYKVADFELMLKVNLTGAFLCGQYAARQMLKKSSGRIINIVSLSGQRGGMGRTGYGASKAGLEVLTKIMAVELSPHGINVNGIAPGPIESDVTRAMHAASGTREAYRYLVPMHRYGEVDEIAAAAAFLASDDANYINGHILNVDGGFGTAGLMYPLPRTEG
ncbi:glucose 1-dehydrogenase (plasmid) [Cupriavidus pinatubonensis]|uniref:SDR family NAD(P)-dependent oxidoreductase n=1 Tax=Cupriavidus pinatubonensis TaxID=248026 RepID=UPI001C737E10|nr:glucose 1-dehydrogenase [Cupriavidus pinatubonensis]QYY33859.1 glucose 1-dehydrogenase [Cupriavidus pinatubonensis]